MSTRRVLEELGALPPVEVDFVTFSGMGEPALASNLEETIVEVSNAFSWPVAVHPLDARETAARRPEAKAPSGGSL